MKKKDVRLYNVLFPLWALFLIPQSWLVAVPGNFILDSLALIAAMYCFHMEDKKEFYKDHILKVFLFGFLADFIAAGAMWAAVLLLEVGGPMGDSLLLTVPGVVFAAGLIWVFNYCFTFRICEKPLRKSLALFLAVATAPYTFLIPSSLLYGL